jgi:hypothetical protein
MAPQMLAEMGPSARFVLLRNAVHTASEGDVINVSSTACGSSIIRAFVAHPDRLSDLDTTCADAIPPIHTPGSFPLTLADSTPATVVTGAASDDERRAATVAAEALGDTLNAWYVAHGTKGYGLRGGRFIGRGDGVIRFRLDHMKWATDASVSGRAVWHFATGGVRGYLRLRDPEGQLLRFVVAWNENDPTATVQMPGGAELELPAP